MPKVLSVDCKNGPGYVITVTAEQLKPNFQKSTDCQIMFSRAQKPDLSNLFCI